MLKSPNNRKSNLLLAGTLAVLAGLLASPAANANPEKDQYGNDISGRIPVEVQTFALTMPAIEEPGLTSASDDFRAPPVGRAPASAEDRFAPCSRQAPQHCPPRH